MVHILAKHLRSEFLAVPQLVRFDMSLGQNGAEPTLLIKANSLSLKYILRNKSFRIMVSQIGRKIAYAVEIPDDPNFPAWTWSLIELPAEVTALDTLITDPRCVVFLFNELAVNIAWAKLDIHIAPSLGNALKYIQFYKNSDPKSENLVAHKIDSIRKKIDPDTHVLHFQNISWNDLDATYITNSLGSSTLSLFSRDEGGQQEEIAVWLTDGLDPKGCVKSPKAQEKRTRELSDILLNYEFGSVLIESKSLSILTRESVPDRQKLTSDLTKHITKATRQLVGGIRNLRTGLPITDSFGTPITVERDKPPHAIILIPDLSLLQATTEFGPDFILRFMKDTGGFIHILDPANLLRAVQAAEMIAKQSKNLTKMMAFDWYLVRRFEIATKKKTPYFNVLFRHNIP